MSATSDIEAGPGGRGNQKQDGSQVVTATALTANEGSSLQGETTSDKPEGSSRRNASWYPKPLNMWKMECSQGPLNWAGSVHWTFRTLPYVTISVVVGFFSYGAARNELYTISLLNVVGVILFIVGAGGSNKYTSAPHTYTNDTLRIILQTEHKEGTVYMLPTKEHGFDAVWSPKVESEHRLIDAAVADWRDKGGYGQASVVNIHSVLAGFYSSTQLATDDIVNLANWLYEPSMHKSMCTIRCNRAPGVHLLSSNVMISLRCAEYLVFMKRGQLRSDQAKYVGKFRCQRWSGADISKDMIQVGSKPGLAGYQDVVRYIYELFDQPVDMSALCPNAPLPESSIVLSPLPDTMDEYVGRLWDHCMAREDSTFAAMDAFCHYWMSDIGSGHGWHYFPLRSVDREGDIVSWHIIWRQAWYLAIIAQLTSMSPIIFSAFVAGILQ
jgi:hypothetical protein